GSKSTRDKVPEGGTPASPSPLGGSPCPIPASRSWERKRGASWANSGMRGAGRARGKEGGSLSGILLVLTTMLASGVEFVEALTIVLATGLTRGWRAALSGTAAAVLVLAAAIAVLGVNLARYIQIEALHLIV